MGKFSKKIVGYVMAWVLVGASLSGCAGGNQTATAPSEPTTSKEEVSTPAKDTEAVKKLVVWGGIPGESGPDEIVKVWNENNPTVQAEYVRYVNDETGNTKLDTALLSGEQIDVFFTYAADLLQKRTDSGIMENLSQYDAKSFINEEIVGGVEAVPKINGEIYSIPTAVETIGILINQSMLDEKNITIPENWTMEQFMDISAQLTGDYNGKKTYGTTLYYSGLPLPIPQTVLGGDWIYKSDTESNFDDPVFKVNSLFKQMMDNGTAMPYGEVISRKLEAYGHPSFLNGEVAMMPTAAWMLRYVKDLNDFPHDFVTTFAPFPRIDENTQNPYQADLNNHISMSSASESKEESWEFIKFWVQEASKHIEKAPAWSKADPEEVVKVVLGDDAEKLFDVEAYKDVMLADDIEYVLVTKTVALPQIMQLYKDQTSKFLLGNIDEDEYYRSLKEKADSALKKEAK